MDTKQLGKEEALREAQFQSFIYVFGTTQELNTSMIEGFPDFLGQLSYTNSSIKCSTCLGRARKILFFKSSCNATSNLPSEPCKTFQYERSTDFRTDFVRYERPNVAKHAM